MKAKGLGKGLNALLSEEALFEQNEKDIKTVNVNDIEPNREQPRRQFNPEELYELSQSIQTYGILQPILVREKGNKYEIIAGERRYRAARLAQIKEVPILIKDFNDQETLEVSIVENVQRENLNPLELAEGYQLLIDKFEYTQETLAKKVGKSRSLITNVLRLTQLHDYAKEHLLTNQITFGHARALISIRDEDQQKELVDLVISKKWSVRELEKYIQKLEAFNKQNKQKKKYKEEINNPFYREIQENLQQKLGTKVNIVTGKKKGKIEIEYYSEDELERLIEMFQSV